MPLAVLRHPAALSAGIDFAVESALHPHGVGFVGSLDSFVYFFEVD
jgi:hypothetical protein